MERFKYIRHGTMKLGKNFRCPICQCEFVVKIEERLGFDVPILIIKCEHDEEIYNYLFEERADNHEEKL